MTAAASASDVSEDDEPESDCVGDPSVTRATAAATSTATMTSLAAAVQRMTRALRRMPASVTRPKATIVAIAV